MLKKLVLSITQCNKNKSLIKDIDIIIADNDSCSSAATVVNELKEEFCNIYKIEYFNFPFKGLSNVRNELIKRALLLNPDYLIFVDDDEFVTSEWLNELVKTIITNKGDLTMGPVISIMGNNVSRFIPCWIKRPIYLNNTKLNFIRTGNLIINVKSLLDRNIWFDPRFNSTGGEDSYFGIQMIKNGATVFWAADAIVFETIPDDRATVEWLFWRYYNGANTYTYMLKVDKQYLKLVKKIFISLIYLTIGACATVIIPIPIKRKYWGLLKFSEGIGGITGLLSIKYYEYK